MDSGSFAHGGSTVAQSSASMHMQQDCRPRSRTVPFVSASHALFANSAVSLLKSSLLLQFCLTAHSPQPTVHSPQTFQEFVSKWPTGSCYRSSVRILKKMSTWVVLWSELAARVSQKTTIPVKSGSDASETPLGRELDFRDTGILFYTAAVLPQDALAPLPLCDLALC